MTNNNRFQISIPQPCSEDWNAMTPDAQGRFCGVCQKSVVDFTGKTPDEIARILSERLGQKVCGRFRKDQLTTTYRLEIPLKRYTAMRLSPVKVFTLALFIAFGASLFSCTDSKGRDRRIEIVVSDDNLRGAENGQTPTDSTKHRYMGEPAVPEVEIGEVAAPPDTVKPPEPPEAPKTTLGRIALPKNYTKGKVKCTEKKEPVKRSETEIMGAVYVPPKEK